MKKINKNNLSSESSAGRKALLLLIVLVSCPFFGQDIPKRKLSENEYGQWGTLYNHSLSPSGKWSCFGVRHADVDTVFVQNTHTTKRYGFASARNPLFLENDFFYCLLPGNVLQQLEPLSGKKYVFQDVARYEIIGEGKYLITLDHSYGEASTLLVRDAEGKIRDSIHGVTEYKINSKGNGLLYCCTANGINTLGIMNFSNYSRLEVYRNGGQILAPAWQKNAASIAFFAQDEMTDDLVIGHYSVTNSRLRMSSEQQGKYLLDNRVVRDLGLEISDDGTKVLFGIKDETCTLVAENDNVEIWKGDDSWVYPFNKLAGDFRTYPKLAFWESDTGKFMRLTDTIRPFGTLTGKQEYCITWNPKLYGPAPKKFNDTDYYITSLKTGETHFLLAKQSGAPGELLMLPGINSILYYRDNNWWLYNPDNNTLLNLTMGLDAEWDTSGDNSFIEFAPHGCAGLSPDTKSVFLYDANDIWEIATDLGSRKRLTHGREKNIVFRINDTEFMEGRFGNYDGYNTRILKHKSDLVLGAISTFNGASGYFYWKAKKGEAPLAYRNSRIDGLRKNKASYSFMEQTYGCAPHITTADKNTPRKNLLFSSNIQQNNYDWGRSVMVYYTVPGGKRLKGALFYPASFDVNKKYPMVVYIYQVKSKELNTYVNPSLYNEDGFNITNYTLNDYFVFLPDIDYKTGNPGFSAAECVTAGVQKVIGIGNVDPKKIGLIGHSFGGYETNFIITQTSMFAAAVSGSGVADSVGWYFSIGDDVIAPQAWRFENQQFRMQRSLYENKRGYIENSPIMNADNIKTPLLLWTGKEDTSVNWKQSVSLYSALRRLEKECMMLVYPGEGHTLFKADNQADLTNRIRQWFDHYLKGVSLVD